MTTLSEAAQQALEALEDMLGWQSLAPQTIQESAKGRAAALRAALAAPVQEPVEPVAYIHRQGRHWEVSERPLADDEKARGWTEEPLYAAPPQRPAEPVQEPVAWRYVPSDVWGDPIVTQDPKTVELARQYGRLIEPLYTAPPQRKP